MENGAGLKTLVTELGTAEVTAVAAYFLGPWLWIPSVADNGLQSVMLTTPFVVLSLELLRRGMFDFIIRWLKSGRSP